MTDTAKVLPDRSWKKDALVEYAKANGVEFLESDNNFAILSKINQKLGITTKKPDVKPKINKKTIAIELSYFDFSQSRVFFEFEMKGENREQLRLLGNEKVGRIAKKFGAPLSDLEVHSIYANDQLMKLSVEMKPGAMVAKLRKVIELC